MNTLFGHLALSFGSHPENLATEALHFVLARSAEARRLFATALSRSGATVPADLRFVTQAADEKGAIPDLVGLSPLGGEMVIVEAKFWAGLTPRQPNAYLDRLPPGGLLAFVAPALRFESLWPELLTRCREKGRGFVADGGGPDWRVAALYDGRRLALTSWRAILADLHAGLVQANEPAVAADVLQLQGLAERMDADAFLPFTSEELTSNLGRRIIQFGQLVDAVRDKLSAERVADTKGQQSSGSKHGEYSQYFRLHRAGCRLYFNPYGWKNHGYPIWLEVRDPSFQVAWPAANAALQPFALEIPSRLIVSRWAATIPLHVPTGLLWDETVECLAAQVRRVAALLATIPDASA